MLILRKISQQNAISAILSQQLQASDVKWNLHQYLFKTLLIFKSKWRVLFNFDDLASVLQGT